MSHEALLASRSLAGVTVQELLCDPVVCTDGFSYERSAAVTWLKNNDTSFVTGDRLCSKDVVPNLALRSRLRAFKSI
jgi:hypothetical protein